MIKSIFMTRTTRTGDVKRKRVVEECLMIKDLAGQQLSRLAYEYE